MQQEALTFPALGAVDVSLNIAPDVRPHVIGDIAATPFQEDSFTGVFFERVPFTAFTGRNIGALTETGRVLIPGGRLLLETGIAAQPDQIVDGLAAAGCVDIEVVRVAHRSAFFLRVSAGLSGL